MAHAYFTSGIWPLQYKKICDAAGMGKIVDKTLRERYQPVYSEVVEEFAEASMAQALQEETAIQVMVDGEDFAGISIMSDARHCWRKNAMFSDVAFLGDRTHRVIKLITVSQDEEQYSQNHELVGTQQFYEWADENAVNILVHAHDNNKSVNKLVENRAAQGHRCVNGNDTWHATKGIARGMKKITMGPKYKERVTWHPELSDKGKCFARIVRTIAITFTCTGRYFFSFISYEMLFLSFSFSRIYKDPRVLGNEELCLRPRKAAGLYR
ncbi:uncharacterized protein LOC118418651 isoform X1 [Branchiostoma floridae]|uniref:Uncharacterized protein LOC118418651 isoform X1 n=1 Tax=Branchiostoma floridae TaxID=7739 RepID=A0A9J7LF13_BRAFL|nr:uncharacterized protein LOC118418651 isoform X1 [Branchiostoma floridae]